MLPPPKQARAPLAELRRVTVSDMFAENAGSPLALLRVLVRRALQDTELPDLKQVRTFQGCSVTVMGVTVTDLSIM